MKTLLFLRRGLLAGGWGHLSDNGDALGDTSRWTWRLILQSVDQQDSSSAPLLHTIDKLPSEPLSPNKMEHYGDRSLCPAHPILCAWPECVCEVIQALGLGEPCCFSAWKFYPRVPSFTQDRLTPDVWMQGACFAEQWL